MHLFVTFNNRQVADCEINSESNLDSVGIHANGRNPESVAIALMAAIECLVIEPMDVVGWMLEKLPASEQKSIRRANACESNEREDAVTLAMKAMNELNRDEQEKIATDILSQWGEDIVSSFGHTLEEGECDAAK